jgi:DNA repair exonuclease SbcCD nuclease subunit
MLVLNDTHIDPNRTGGTTPLSHALLREYMHENFEKQLDIGSADGCVLLNGDLHDGFTISNAAVLRVYTAIGARLESGAIKTLFLARGNHDIARDTTKLSSFDLLGALLVDSYPQRVVVITEPTLIAWGEHAADQGWVVPHAPNQDIFDLWIAEVGMQPLPFVFVHCNYSNGFAASPSSSAQCLKQ